MAERFGRYETIRPIASGGMATVYLGKAVGEGGFERLVAIKVMHQHLAADREFVAMFLDEARLAARIRHPNVVATFDVQTAPEGMFIIMDYVEGATLSEIVRFVRKQGDTIATGVALRIVLDVLTGLHVAHELRDDQGELLQLIHRDVSPQNVLVGTDGVARLTDFGVARAESRLSSTRGGHLKGKIAYMAPEQIIDDPVDRRADVYAAGALLWETLVGRRLFRASNEGALVHAIVSGARQSPTEVNPRVPEAVSRACMRALALESADRFPTAAAFADELEDAARLAGLPIATSRAVSTCMAQWLPDLERGREVVSGVTTGSGSSGTPSGVSSSSAVSGSTSQPSVVARGPLTEGAAGLGPGSADAEVADARLEDARLEGELARGGETSAGPVGLSRAPGRRQPIRLAIAAAVAAIVVAASVGFWLLSGTAGAPTAAADSTSGADGGASAPAEAPVVATVAVVSSAVADAAGADSAPDDAAAPVASAGSSGDAVEVAPSTRPTSAQRGPRTGPTATSPKASPTSYDPEQL